MKEDTSSNASTSAATSTSEQKDKNLTESELLAREAADAKNAMKAAWSDLKQTATGTVDIRRWTGRYPWIATASALAAGVAAGYALTPRDRDEAKELWEKLKAKFAGAKDDGETIYVEPAKGHPAAEKPSMLSMILHQAMKSVLPLVTSMMAAKAEADAAEAEHNGNGK